MVFITEI